MKKTFGKRILSGITSALISVSCVLPSVSVFNGGAAINLVTSVGGNAEKEDVTLLVGANNQLRGDSVEKTIKNADATYALGIASQFCVFLQNDFRPSESDAEGRVAVGGNIISTVGWDAGYEIGKGDFESNIPLQELIGDTDYAEIIWNASQDTEFQKIKMSGGYGAYGDKEKTIVVQTPYGAEYMKANQASHTDSIFQTELINFDDEFEKLKKKSLILSRKTADGVVTVDGDTATFDAKALGSTKEMVVFNCTSEEWNAIKGCKYFNFVNIPSLPEPRECVEVNPDTKVVEHLNWDYSYIVINVAGEQITVATDDVKTTINGVSVSLGLDGKHNNNYGVTSLLYNFYQAQTLDLGKNFQGTIYAPNADVKDDVVSGRGHLSGALIAKSFVGETEFGYRPYDGPASLIGLSSNYTIDISKFAEDGITPLAGATIGLYEADDEGVLGELVDKFTTDETGKITASIDPGEHERDGENVTPLSTSIKYALKEIAAPEGYAVNNETVYYFTLEEIGIIEDDNNGLPDYTAQVKITLLDSDGKTPLKYAAYSPIDIDNNVYVVDDVAYRFKNVVDEDNFTVVNAESGAEVTDSNFVIDYINQTTDPLEPQYDNSYFVYYDGEIVNPVINLMSKLEAVNAFEFVNRKALTIKKTSPSGKPLSGAEFSLTKEEYTTSMGAASLVDSTEVKSWTTDGSLEAIALDDIESVVGSAGSMWQTNYKNIYRIKETDVPEGYALPGNDIVFIRAKAPVWGSMEPAVDAIYYKEVKSGTLDNLPVMFMMNSLYESMNINGWTKIVLDTSTQDDRNFTIVNYREGIELELRKIDSITKNVVKGATLELYAKDGTLIKTWENFDGSINLRDDSTLNNSTEGYVKGGFIEPGIYYIVETQVPVGYKDTLLNQKMYFSINSDGTVTVGEPKYLSTVDLKK